MEPFPPFSSANMAASEPPRELQAGAAQFTMTTIESLTIKARNIQTEAYEAGLYKAATDALKLEAQLAGLLVERRDTQVDATRTVNVLHAPNVARSTEQVNDYYAELNRPNAAGNGQTH